MIVSLLLFAGLGALPSGGCWPVSGDFIRAEDLAAAEPAFGSAPGRTVGPAPLAGSQRRFSGAELRRLALRLGVGAQLSAEPQPVCFAYPVAPLHRDQVVAAVERLPGAKGGFALTEYSQFPVPSGDLIFRDAAFIPNMRDGTLLLTGHVEYAKGRRTPVWARVRPMARPQGLLAAQELLPGTRLEAHHLRVADLEPGTVGALASVNEAVDLTVRRHIGAGQVLRRNMLSKTRDVDRGEAVLVSARAGGATLTFKSRAESPGYRGEQILLQNPDSGLRFRAIVDGRAQASVKVEVKEP